MMVNSTFIAFVTECSHSLFRSTESEIKFSDSFDTIKRNVCNTLQYNEYQWIWIQTIYPIIVINFWKTIQYLRWSLKSSTRMISLIWRSGLRFKTLQIKTNKLITKLITDIAMNSWAWLDDICMMLYWWQHCFIVHSSLHSPNEIMRNLNAIPKFNERYVKFFRLDSL